MPHTVIIDIDGLHNSVAIDRVILQQGIRLIVLDVSRRNWDSQSSPKHGTMLEKYHAEVPFMKKKTATENHLSSPTAQEDAERMRNREQRTSVGGEERGRPTEYVVNRVIDRIVHGQRTLFRLQSYGFGLNDGA